MVEAIDADQWTSLHYVAWKNSVITAVNLLVYHNVNTEARAGDNSTALHVAARFNSWRIAYFLLDSGAEVDARDQNGQTPLHLAAWKKSEKVAAELLRKCANINAKGDDGKTPADYARKW